MIKEWTCTECKHPFDSELPICSECGALGKRAYRTAPGFSTGKSRKMEKFMGKAFEERGITNFSNMGGENKVSFKGESQSGPVVGAWGGANAAKAFQSMYGAAPNIPQLPHKEVQAEPGAVVNPGGAAALRERSQVFTK